MINHIAEIMFIITISISLLIIFICLIGSTFYVAEFLKKILDKQGKK